ncbi:MAG TPA: hypothetical protein V6D50_08250 [Chroococcales cyanobacterium]|jgi:hypothetical protein
MSEEKHRRTQITQYESLYDLKVLDLGSASGHDWTSVIQENCLATNNQAVKEKGSEPTRKTALIGILTILIFGGAPMFILNSQLTQIGQEVNTKSIEQVRGY